MKIKKTYQGTIPENKILNIESTSQTDTYSCAKINEMTEDTYSTEEQIIGKGIDGKPLYKKTLFYNGAINANESTLVGTLAPNIKDVLDVSYTLTNSIKNNVYFNYVDGSSESLSITISKSTGDVTVISVGESWSTPDVFVTVKYTKTTD